MKRSLMMDWKVEKSKHVYRDRWVSLRADRCVTPTGGLVDPFYVLEYSDWVNVVAITRESEVVMVRQYRHGLGRTLVELPGGAVDDNGESPLVAAQRELLEETGYTSTEWSATGVLAPNPATHTNLTHCFVAKDCIWEAEPNLDDNEEIEVRLVSLSDFIDRTTSGDLLQAQHIASAAYALLALGLLKAAE